MVCESLQPLGIDQAAAFLDWGAGGGELLGVSTECYHCHPQLLATDASDACIAVQTRFPMQLEAVVGGGAATVSREFHFQEHGVYSLQLDASGLGVVTLEEGDYAEAPLWISLAVLAALAILYRVVSVWVLSSSAADYRAAPTGDATAVQSDVEGQGAGAQPKKKSRRLNSLDTFRGLSLAIMVFVNAGGGAYWWLDHSAWNGLTVADLVFPWFCWIMGVSMAFSMSAQHRRGATLRNMLKTVGVRGLKLLAIGLFLAKPSKLGMWRLPGVLQYFGTAYLVVGGTVLLCEWTFDAELSGQARWRVAPPTAGALRDVLPYWRNWLVSLCALGLYCGITFALPVPGCPAGYLGPGGIGDWGAHPDCVGGAHHYVDLQLFGADHIYHHPTCIDPYECVVPYGSVGGGAYDPEGLVGVLTCIFMVFLGNQTGRTLLLFQDHRDRLVRFAAWGAGLCLLAGALCGFSQNGGPVPVNKNLWSPSFVILLAGFANFALAACYVLVDMRGLWSGAPFRVVGMNSIVVYCGSEILFDYFPFAYNAPDSHAGHLIENIICVASWIAIAQWLHWKKIYISV